MLKVKSFALGVGVSYGIISLVLGWAAMFGWGGALVRVYSSLYAGYEPSFVGGIIGGIWGFVLGCIGGYLVAYFYNYFNKKA